MIMAINPLFEDAEDEPEYERPVPAKPAPAILSPSPRSPPEIPPRALPLPVVPPRSSPLKPLPDLKFLTEPKNCTYKTMGCKWSFPTMGEVKQHMVECKYRPFSCIGAKLGIWKYDSYEYLLVFLCFVIIFRALAFFIFDRNVKMSK